MIFMPFPRFVAPISAPPPLAITNVASMKHEGPRQRPRPMAMPVTGDSDQAIIIVARRFWAPTVSPAHQCRIELALNHSLNKFAHPIAYPSFDRIEPVVEQINRCVGGRLRGIRLRANAHHGVVSSPAHQRRMIRG